MVKSTPNYTGLTREIVILLFLSLVMAVGTNLFRQTSIPWAEDWTARQLTRFESKSLVTPEEAMDLHNKGLALFVDAREPEMFAKEHIAGAMSLPFNPFDGNMDALIAELPRDRMLVIYCDSVACSKSQELADQLDFYGFDKALVSRKGWKPGTT